MTNFVHGMTGTPTHTSWRAMKDRCNQSSHGSYEYYGERNIGYDSAWEEFINFYADMGDRPEGTTLDRIDTDKGYSKENCRWSDNTDQSRNRRNNVRITYGGQTKVMSEWAQITGIPYDTLRARIVRLKWPAGLAFCTPVKAQTEISLTFGGQTLTTSEWSRVTGIPNGTIRSRVRGLGWSVEAALTTPVGAT